MKLFKLRSISPNGGLLCFFLLLEKWAHHTCYWWMEKSPFRKCRWINTKVVKCIMRKMLKSNTHWSEIFTRRQFFHQKDKIWAQKKSQISKVYGLALTEELPATDFPHCPWKIIRDVALQTCHWHVPAGHSLLPLPNTRTAAITTPPQTLQSLPSTIMEAWRNMKGETKEVGSY